MQSLLTFGTTLVPRRFCASVWGWSGRGGCVVPVRSWRPFPPLASRDPVGGISRPAAKHRPNYERAVCVCVCGFQWRAVTFETRLEGWSGSCLIWKNWKFKWGAFCFASAELSTVRHCVRAVAFFPRWLFVFVCSRFFALYFFGFVWWVSDVRESRILRISWYDLCVFFLNIKFKKNIYI